MRATFDPDELRNAFALAASIAPARSPKQVLQDVKLSVGPDGATLEATDLEVAVRVRVEGADVDEPGAALLPTARFGAILRTWAGGPIPLALDDGGTLRVGSGRAAYKLNVGDASLFPSVPAAPTGLRREVDADALATALKRTVFACDPHNTRYAMGGVLVEPDPDDAGRLLLVATDGRRLARAAIAATTEGDPGNITRVVPVKAVKLLLRCLPGGPASLAFDGRSMAATIGGVEVWSRLVEGRFPAYRDVFPAGVPHRAAFAAGALRAAVEQAAVVTGDESRGVDFALSAGSLRLSARAADAGESAVECDAGYDGPEVAFALDPNYILDMLRTLDADAAVVLAAIDAKHGVVLTADDGAYAYVAMPMTREA